MANTDTSFSGYTATVHMRPTWSIGHDLRIPEYVDTQRNHIDPHGYHRNIINRGNTEQEIYDNVFGDAIKEYNARQKRADRRIDNYLEKVMNDGRRGKNKNIKSDHSRKPLYCQLFYIGNQDLHCSNELTEKVITLYITKVLPKHFPNWVSCNANIHGDEFSLRGKNKVKTPSALHVHNIGMYVAHALTPEELKIELKYREDCKQLKKKELEAQGIPWNEKKWKQKDWRRGMVERWGKALERGPALQCSLSGGCAEMGFYTEKKLGTAQQQVEMAMLEDFRCFCEELGIKIDRTKRKHKEHLGRDEYIDEKELKNQKKELEQDKEILKAARIALENELDDFAFEKEKIQDKEAEAEKKMIEVKKCVMLLNQKRDLLEDKENKIEKREKDIQIKTDNLNEKEVYLNDKESIVNKRNESLNIKQDELNNREKNIEKQENEIKVEKASCNEERKQLTNAQSQFADEVFVARKEYNNHQKSVREWQEAAKTINSGIDEKSTDDWIDSEVKNLRQSKINFPQFIKKIKNGIKGLISKVKKLYDEKIKHYEQELNGYDFIDPKTNKKTHYFGSSELQKMFFHDTSPNTFRQIAKDMDESGVSSYEQLYKKKPRIMEKHFEYVRQINRTNEITR